MNIVCHSSAGRCSGDPRALRERLLARVDVRAGDVHAADRVRGPVLPGAGVPR